MKYPIIAICAIALISTGFAGTEYRPSDPLFNVQADWTGEQINAPKCSDLSSSTTLYDIKWVRGFQSCTDEDLRSWQKDMQQYRVEKRIRVGYDGSRYEMPELKWTQSSFIQPQMMVQDRYFYDT